jgi:hypothetical protein
MFMVSPRSRRKRHRLRNPNHSQKPDTWWSWQPFPACTARSNPCPGGNAAPTNANTNWRQTIGWAFIRHEPRQSGAIHGCQNSLHRRAGAAQCRISAVQESDAAPALQARGNDRHWPPRKPGQPLGILQGAIEKEAQRESLPPSRQVTGKCPSIKILSTCESDNRSSPLFRRLCVPTAMHRRALYAVHYAGLQPMRLLSWTFLLLSNLAAKSPPFSFCGWSVDRVSAPHGRRPFRGAVVCTRHVFAGHVAPHVTRHGPHSVHYGRFTSLNCAPIVRRTPSRHQT